MEIKIFGRSLFSAKLAKSDTIWQVMQSPSSEARQSKYLPDFHKNTTGGSFGTITALEEYVVIPSSNGGAVAVPQSRFDKKTGKPGKNAKKQSEPRFQVTPKGVYEMKLLNDEKFILNTEAKYVDQQLSDFKDKLGLIKSEEYDMRNGVDELTSIVMRLENRKKYPEVKDFFEEFPYTTTSKINQVVKTHSHLKVGQIAQFIADMPKEAVEIMKRYNESTAKVCGKQAVFYIIADQKDFKKTDTRRDPILLAQSPFGHFWQILGAWADEMMFLEEL